MSRGQHVRRSRLVYLAGPAAGATMFVTGVFLGTAAGAPLGTVVPTPPPPGEVQIDTAIRVSRENPVSHPPSTSPADVQDGRPVARVVSPCTAKRAQLQAVEDEIRNVYRTATALELTEDGGIIARAIALECGWVDR